MVSYHCRYPIFQRGRRNGPTKLPRLGPLSILPTSPISFNFRFPSHFIFLVFYFFLCNRHYTQLRDVLRFLLIVIPVFHSRHGHLHTCNLMQIFLPFYLSPVRAQLNLIYFQTYTVPIPRRISQITKHPTLHTNWALPQTGK